MATSCEKISNAYFVEIKGRTTPVLTLKEASDFWCALRDRSDLGASKSPAVHLVDWRGKHVGYISYNGRIWAGWPRDWKPTDKPLYDNRAEG